MMTRTLAFLVAALLMALPAMARNYSLSSPDGSLTISVSVGEDLLWSLSRNGVELVSPSPAALVLADGKVLGTSMKVRRVLRSSVDKTEDALFFKRSSVRDHYNELKLISTDFDVIFRAYDDGVAYRFVTHREVTVRSSASLPTGLPGFRMYGTRVKSRSSSSTPSRTSTSIFPSLLGAMEGWPSCRLLWTVQAG